MKWTLYPLLPPVISIITPSSSSARWICKCDTLDGGNAMPFKYKPHPFCTRVQFSHLQAPQHHFLACCPHELILGNQQPAFPIRVVGFRLTFFFLRNKLAHSALWNCFVRFLLLDQTGLLWFLQSNDECSVNQPFWNGWNTNKASVHLSAGEGWKKK